MQESQEALEKRIAALERAVTDGEGEHGTLADSAVTAERVETLEAQLDDVTDRIGELDAATQALRGYVGNIRSVNRDVEQRADAALAKAESLETQQGGQTQGEPEKRSCPRCGRSEPDGTAGADSDRDRAQRETRVWRQETPRETASGRETQIRDGTETARAVAFDEGESHPEQSGPPVETDTGGVMGRVRELL